MIVKRKLYSGEEGMPQITSADLQEEQLRLQRQALMVQKQRDKIRADETRRRLQMTQAAQKREAEKDMEEAKNQIKIKKLEQDNENNNIGLYKSRSKIITPIPMRG